MNKILAISLLLFTSILCHAQGANFIRQKCQSPYGSNYGGITIAAVGDILHVPCPTRASIFSGIVDFSGASIIGISPLTTKGDIWGYSTTNTRVPIGTNGQVLTADSSHALGLKWATPSGVTGTGTTNFLTRWTNGAGGVIGNSGLSFTGTLYNFQNTGSTSTFPLNLSAGTGSGFFNVGESGKAYFEVLQNPQTASLQANNGFTVTSGLALFEVSPLGAAQINAGAKVVQLGDFVGAFNQVSFALNDTSKYIHLFTTDSSGEITADTGPGSFKAGDFNNRGSHTAFIVDDSSSAITSNTLNFYAGDVFTFGNGATFSVLDGSTQFVFNKGIISIVGSNCAGTVALGGVGTFNLATNINCWGLAQHTPLAIVSGVDTAGIIKVSATGVITSSVGVADSGRNVNYWIIDTP